MHKLLTRPHTRANNVISGRQQLRAIKQKQSPALFCQLHMFPQTPLLLETTLGHSSVICTILRQILLFYCTFQIVYLATYKTEI